MCLDLRNDSASFLALFDFPFFLYITLSFGQTFLFLTFFYTRTKAYAVKVFENTNR